MPKKLKIGMGITMLSLFALGIVVGFIYTSWTDSRQYEQLSTEYDDLLSEYTVLNNEYGLLEDQITNYEKLRFTDSRQYEQLSTEYDDLLSEYTVLNNEYGLLEDQITNYEKLRFTDSRQYEQLRIKYNDLVSQYNTLYGDYQLNSNYVKGLEEKSKITIYDQKIHWNVKDGSNNSYHWILPIQTFENKVKYNTDYDVRKLANSNTNEKFNVAKLEPFVQKRFGGVIDSVWDNSESEFDFVYNVWSITNNLTVYSEDIGEYPRYAEETLGRGGGDCEDLAILIVDLILSSSHTKNWDIELWAMDSNNPQSPKDVNHVIILIDYGGGGYWLEPTAQTWESAMKWNDYDIRGWGEQI